MNDVWIGEIKQKSSNIINEEEEEGGLVVNWIEQSPPSSFTPRELFGSCVVPSSSISKSNFKSNEEKESEESEKEEEKEKEDNCVFVCGGNGLDGLMLDDFWKIQFDHDEDENSGIFCIYIKLTFVIFSLSPQFLFFFWIESSPTLKWTSLPPIPRPRY